LAVAGEKYREFIEKYPDNELAEDAKLALQNLGKSPQEIIGSAKE
jgi:TolA-binding protein